MKFYKGKNILVTGGTGMIGIPLVKKLIQLGAKVTIASLDDKNPNWHNSFMFRNGAREEKHPLINPPIWSKSSKWSCCIFIRRN